MATRKKKTVVEEKPIEQKPANTISYTGTVKVSVAKGNRIISSKTYHNKGGQTLFDFIYRCLAGQYDSSRAPQYIKLYTSSSTSVTEDLTNSTVLSGAIAKDKVTLNEESGNTNSISYHFTIPRSYILNVQGSTDINQACLYSGHNTDIKDKDNYSALFCFAKSETEWDPIRLTDVVGDYNIFIDWTMTFK